MKELCSSLKHYNGLKSALFTVYYIALMPFITTILKLIMGLISKEPNPIGYLSGQFYVLIFLVPLLVLAIDLYPLIIGRIKITSFKQTAKTYPELLVLVVFLLWCLLASVLQLIFFKKSNAFSFVIVPYAIAEGFPLFIYYGMCLIMAFFIKDRKICKNIILIMLITSALLCVTTIIDPSQEYLGGGLYSTKWAGLFLNSNHYGYYLTMFMMASSTLYCICYKKWLKILAICTTSLLAIVMMFNDTFGCLLATFVSLILLVIMMSLFKGKFRWTYMLPLGIFVAASIIMMPIAKYHESTYTSFFAQCYNLFKELFIIADNPISDAAKQAGTNRWDLWLSAIKEIASSPLIGTGDVTMRPHNEYIQYALVWGIPSLVIYLAAFVIIFTKAIKYRKCLSGLTLVCLFTVGGYLISAMFGNTMPHVMPFFMVFLGFLIRNLGEDITSQKQGKLPVILSNNITSVSEHL